jgi:NADPH:quinone reductase-like Zn-dependent oxidoreductase
VVGGPVWPDLVDVLERGGRYTCSGAIAGPMVELDLRTLYLRDLTFTGSTVIDLEVMPNLIGYIERGAIKPVLAATYPLSELRAAQEAFVAKTHTGNIVVVP